MRLTPALAVLALAAALALGGCGGGDQGDITASQTAAVPKPKAPAPAPAPKPMPEKQRDTPAAPTPAHVPDTPGDPTPGTKAPAPGVPVTPEADNSVQTFGAEGQSTQRQQATATLEAYLDARAAGKWATACEATSAQYKSELAKSVSPTSGKARPKGCAETLSALFGEAPEARLKSAAQVGEVLSFRVREDGYAYLIFKGAGGAVEFIAMANGGGTWKVNTLEPAAFQGSQGETQ